jgi:hypothetical protein
MNVRIRRPVPGTVGGDCRKTGNFEAGVCRRSDSTRKSAGIQPAVVLALQLR